VTEQEMRSVLKLKAPKRFEYLVKFDTEAAWGLREGGWTALADKDERPLLALWPAREYAEAYRLARNATSVAEAIPLADLLERLLPGMRSNGGGLAIFPTPAGRSVVVSAEELDAALRDELLKYE
jgi:hypothetical protein